MSSPSSSSFCCCTGLFRKKQDDLQIKVNGVTHLKVPQVKLNGVGQDLESIESPIRFEDFHTARTSTMPTSRVDQVAVKVEDEEAKKPFYTMGELMRMVRLEEGLHVTPRDAERIYVVRDDPPQSQKAKGKIRAAVFDEFGDITSRSITSVQSKLSMVSLNVPSLQPLQPSSSTIVYRRLTAAPQTVHAFVVVTYAYITAILSTLTSLILK